MDYEEQADIQAGCRGKNRRRKQSRQKILQWLRGQEGWSGGEERRWGAVRAIKQRNKNELEKKRGKRGRLSKRHKVKETRRKTRGMMGGE